MLIDKDGNVGIGTSSPSHKLHVNGDIRTGYNSSLYLGGTDVYWRDASGHLNGSTESSITLNYDSIENGTGFFQTKSGGTVVAKIDNAGNMGIGTTNPASKLHINSGQLIIQSSVGTASDATLKFRDDGSGTDQWWIAIDESQSNKLYFYDDYNNQYRMVIQQDGNVGIGTTNPGSYKLAVKGNIRAEEVVVETGWSDFVFEANYDLMPLPEVEQYIAEHQRLPDVPSAEEVAADGLSPGESQALLLQKVEELTLYVIELDKENKALKDSYELIMGQLSGQID